MLSASAPASSAAGDMRIMMDAALPALMAAETPAGDVYHRWDRGDIDDEGLLREAARKDYEGVIFYGRRYLLQPRLRQLADDLGIKLAAVQAPNPVAAKSRIARNAERLRSVLRDTPYALILSASVEEFPPRPDEQSGSLAGPASDAADPPDTR